MAVRDDMDDDDIDDLDLSVDDDRESGVFRWMSVMVVLLAVAGFLGLAWYAYKSGGEPIDEKDTELVMADTTPVKEPPVNPGGMPIPNQDKTVYEGLVGGKPESGKVVEHILASPEAPVSREGGDTESWMSDQVKEKLKNGQQYAGGADPLAADKVAKEEAIEPAKELVSDAKPEAKPAESLLKETPKTDETAIAKAEPFQPSKVHKTEEKKEELAKEHAGEGKPPVAAKEPDAQKPVPEEHSKQLEKIVAAEETPKAEVKPEKVAAPKEEPKHAKEPEKKAEVKNEKKEAKTANSASGGADTPPSGSRAQLGAFKSQAEAEGQWKKIAKSFADDVKGKSHYVVRADLGAKGVYYRLQVAPFSSSKDVEQFCLSLVSDGQGCFLAKGK